MKNLVAIALVAAFSLVIIGCQKGEEKAVKESKPVESTSLVSLDADICGSCGCCAECDSHCKDDAEKCAECGMKPGSTLCCTGIKPADVVYCKDCGYDKASEKCCADGNEKCSCGMAKGSDLCCKLKSDSATSDDHDSHDHK